MSICKELPLRINKIVVNGESLEIGHYLRKSYPDVTEALVELPSIMEWLNQGLQDWTEWLELEEFNKKRAEAEVYFALKQGGFSAKYAEKMTEAALVSATILDPRVYEAVKAVAQSKANVNRFKNSIETLRLKFELIRTVEATRRHVDQGVSAKKTYENLEEE